VHDNRQETESEWYGSGTGTSMRVASLTNFEVLRKPNTWLCHQVGYPKNFHAFWSFPLFFSYRIGWWENLQEKTQKNDGKNHGFQLRFSLKPIQWLVYASIIHWAAHFPNLWGWIFFILRLGEGWTRWSFDGFLCPGDQGRQKLTWKTSKAGDVWRNHGLKKW
jgi:hypothetical protein